MPEFLERRYDNKVRLLYAIISLIGHPLRNMQQGRDLFGETEMIEECEMC